MFVMYVSILTNEILMCSGYWQNNIIKEIKQVVFLSLFPALYSPQKNKKKLRSQDRII